MFVLTSILKRKVLVNMTNQEKQAQKSIIRKDDLETARNYIATDIELHSDKADYVENAVYRVGEVIAKIRDERKWSNSTLIEYLDTNYFPSVHTISRLVNHDEKRIPNAAQLFDLRRVFGISLDALADNGDPFAFEQMSDGRLIEILEEISSELGRRKRQK